MARAQTRSLVVSEWMSLDGVFDADAMPVWWTPFESPERGQLIKQGIDAAGALLLGRVTYEMLAAYWPHTKTDPLDLADRLNALPKHVVSTKLARADWNNTTIVKDNVVERVGELKRQPGGDLLVFGSANLVATLARADLIDEYRFLVHPIVVGRGKRAFAPEAPTSKLGLAETRKLPHDVMLLTYRPAR